MKFASLGVSLIFLSTPAFGQAIGDPYFQQHAALRDCVWEHASEQDVDDVKMAHAATDRAIAKCDGYVRDLKREIRKTESDPGPAAEKIIAEVRRTTFNRLMRQAIGER